MLITATADLIIIIGCLSICVWLWC